MPVSVSVFVSVSVSMPVPVPVWRAVAPGTMPPRAVLVVVVHVAARLWCVCSIWPTPVGVDTLVVRWSRAEMTR